MSSVKSFAAPSLGYSCVGKDKVSKNNIAISIDYSDDDGNGYTNQSLTITAINGWEIEPISYQLVSRLKAEGKKNSSEEIQLHTSRVLLDVDEKSQSTDYKLTIKSPKVGIQGASSMDVTAVCVGLNY